MRSSFGGVHLFLFIIESGDTIPFYNLINSGGSCKILISYYVVSL